MSYFKKLFGFDRSAKSKTRNLSNINNAIDSGYIQYLTQAQISYNNNDLRKAFVLVNKAIEVSDVEHWMPYALKGGILED